MVVIAYWPAFPTKAINQNLIIFSLTYVTSFYINPGLRAVYDLFEGLSFERLWSRFTPTPDIHSLVSSNTYDMAVILVN